MREFVYRALPMQVTFARGSVGSLAEVVASIADGPALVLSTPEQSDLAQRVADALGDRSAGVLAEARMHVPSPTVERALQHAESVGAESCVAVGGGSTVGLGKAVALHSDVPVVAVPTTFAGSEMTPIWGITADGRKTTGRDARVLPRAVVYDPDLVDTLPVDMCAVSGLNAIAHAVEGLYAPDTSPVVRLMAAEGARAFAAALPAIGGDDDADARSEALYGAWLCGATLGATTMGLHHKLCHVLGGTLDLPHAATHAVVLPHVMAHNLVAATGAAAILRDVWGTTDPARYVQELARALDVPGSLAELGMREGDVDRVVEEVVASPYANPRAVKASDVRSIVVAAWSGATVGA